MRYDGTFKVLFGREDEQAGCRDPRVLLSRLVDAGRSVRRFVRGSADRRGPGLHWRGRRIVRGCTDRRGLHRCGLWGDRLEESKRRFWVVDGWYGCSLGLGGGWGGRPGARNNGPQSSVCGARSLACLLCPSDASALATSACKFGRLGHGGVGVEVVVGVENLRTAVQVLHRFPSGLFCRKILPVHEKLYRLVRGRVPGFQDRRWDIGWSVGWSVQ